MNSLIEISVQEFSIGFAPTSVHMNVYVFVSKCNFQTMFRWSAVADVIVDRKLLMKLRLTATERQVTKQLQ